MFTNFASKQSLKLLQPTRAAAFRGNSIPLRQFASGTSFEKFDYEDPFKLNDMLTDEERAIQDAARAYSQEKLMPRVREAYNKEHFDLEIMKEMGEMGFLGCTISDYDLPGLSSTAYGLINREVERVDSGYRSALSVQSSLVMFPINAYANKSVKDRLIPKLATAELIGCFGLTEPGAGSNPGEMITRAVDKGDHYVLNGSKTWITNSPHADVFVIWCKDE